MIVDSAREDLAAMNTVRRDAKTIGEAGKLDGSSFGKRDDVSSCSPRIKTGT